MHESNSKEIFLWMLRRRQRYRVTGDSMLPLLATDDEVLVDLKAYRCQAPRIGDIVIARHPAKVGLQIIKRVKEVRINNLYQLHGDNPDPELNSPSLVPIGMILGRVTCRFSP